MVGFWLSTEPALAEGGERSVFKKLRRPGRPLCGTGELN